MKNRLLACIWVLAVLTQLAGCAKTGPAGATGPQGPSGSTGPQGPPGNNGTNGTNGTNGGADSIQYSPWITLSMESGFDEFGTSLWIDSIAAPQVTDSIITQGAVLGFYISPTYLANGDSSIINVDNSNVSFLTQIVKPGLIILYTYQFDMTGTQYRYVIVPAKIQVTGSQGMIESYTPGQLKAMDYSSLRHFFCSTPVANKIAKP